MGDWIALLARSQRNAWTVTIEDVRACEIPETTFRERGRRMGWRQHQPGVWTAPGSEDTYEREITAVARSLTGGWMFTGDTVLWLAGCLPTRPDEVHVLLRPAHHHAARRGVRFFRGRWVDGDEPGVLGGHPTAPIERSLTDVSALRSPRQLVSRLTAIDRQRQGTIPGVVGYVERRGRWPGRRNLLEALAEVGTEVTHSRAEATVRAEVRQLGLKPHPRPFGVTENGIRLGEIDIAFPPLLYGAEIDGPHHLLPEVAKADKVRDRALQRRGWHIDRFSVEEVDRSPATVAQQVRAGVVAAAHRLGVPVLDPRWMVAPNG